jgi:CRISPR type III-B/RAMP module RAMP protein Cmr6
VQPAALPEAVAAAGSSERFGGLTERNKDFFLKNFFLPAFQSVQQNLPFAAIRARHEELLESFRLRGLTVHSRILRSSARIAQGLTTQTSLGSAGIALDRAFGYPIIPATVLRGALRQYLERQVVRPARRPRRGEIAPATTNETAPADAAKRILDALGSRGVAGQITILDAIPAKLPMVAGVDLSACHHEEWYTNGAPAADSDSPSITRFLSLRPGAEFSFAILAETQEDGADLASLAMDALTRALRTDGVGARSTLGYGRLNPVPVSTGVRKRKNRRGKGRVVISVSPSGKSEGNSDTGQQPAVVNATPAAGGSETGATTTP